MNDSSLSNWVENLDPTGDPPDLHSKFDDSHRDDLIDVFKEFCSHLNTRLTIFARHGPSTIDIFDTDEELKSKHIGQEPHSFLRDFLIAPVVELLGYSFITEPRPAQTEPHIWSADVYPDLRLIPMNWPTDETVPTIIVEHKKIGRYKYASKELRRDYLEKANRPVYGLATDVLTWRGFRVSSEGECVPLAQASIGSILQRIRRSLLHEGFEFYLRPGELTPFLDLFEMLPGNVNPAHE